MTEPAWLASARAWPVAFAQVREDPRIDEAIVDRLPADSSLLMIASGGCTAAFLAGHSKLRDITLVDTNPAQLALTRLKLRLLEAADPEMRCRVLGHSPMDSGERGDFLRREFSAMKLADDILGPMPRVVSTGPDYAGRYEQLFAALQSDICADAILTRGLNELLDLESAERQQEWLERNASWWSKLTVVFERVFALANLTALFGEGATRNPRQSFAAHFLEQLRHVAVHQPVRRNPFVWQLLKGHFPRGAEAPWLHRPVGPTGKNWRFVPQAMTDAMHEAGVDGRRHDMVHLSNVLDWLDPEAATRTLRNAWDCAAPGGWVVIRQLNSTLDVRALGESVGWAWDSQWSDELLEIDQSFFYRKLHVGQKR
jgi:S-adenosylmethionine-diacylglycerol 3-amino-3-carboxypropyl transferase